LANNRLVTQLIISPEFQSAQPEERAQQLRSLLSDRVDPNILDQVSDGELLSIADERYEQLEKQPAQVFVPQAIASPVSIGRIPTITSEKALSAIGEATAFKDKPVTELAFGRTINQALLESLEAEGGTLLSDVYNVGVGGVTGLLRLTEDMTTPFNLAMLAIGTGIAKGLGGARGMMVHRAMAGGFSILGLLETSRALPEAALHFMQGDYTRGTNSLVYGLGIAGLSGLGLKFAAKGPTAPTVSPKTKRLAKLKASHEQLAKDLPDLKKRIQEAKLRDDTIATNNKATEKVQETHRLSINQVLSMVNRGVWPEGYKLKAKPTSKNVIGIVPPKAGAYGNVIWTVAENLSRVKTPAGKKLKRWMPQKELGGELYKKAKKVSQKTREETKTIFENTLVNELDKAFGSKFGKGLLDTPELKAQREALRANIAEANKRPEGMSIMEWRRMRERATPMDELITENQTLESFANAMDDVMGVPRGGGIHRWSGPKVIEQALNNSNKRIKKVFHYQARGLRYGANEVIGLTAELIANGALRIAKGAFTFARWSKEMIKEHGEGIKPILKDLYEASLKKASDDQLFMQSKAGNNRTIAEIMETLDPDKPFKVDAKGHVWNYPKYLTKDPSKQAEIFNILMRNIDEDWWGRIGEVHDKKYLMNAAKDIIIDNKRKYHANTVTTDAEAWALAEAISGVRGKMEYYRRNLRDKQKAGTDTPADYALFQEAMYEAGVLFGNKRIVGSNAGRLLNAMKMVAGARKSGGADQIMKALNRLGKDRDEISKIAAALEVMAADGKTAKDQWNFVQNTLGSGVSDIFNWMFLNNLLSSPVTQLRNVIGNIANMSLTIPVQGTAVALDIAKSKMFGRERQIYANEALWAATGMREGLKAGTRKAYHIIKEGIDPTDPTSFDFHRIEIGRTEWQRRGLNIIARNLEATDAFFRTVAYEMHRHALIYARARQTAAKKGWSLNKVTEHVHELLKETPNDIIDEAAYQAKRTTFQEDPVMPIKEFMQFKSKVAKRGDPLNIISNMVLTSLVPFVKTPANIIKQGLEFSPFGFLTSGKAASLPEIVARRQQFGARNVTMRQAKATLGTIALLTAIAYKDRMTGNGPTSPGERAAWRQQGKVPYSILIPKNVITDKMVKLMGGSMSEEGAWVPFQMLQPLSVQWAGLANAVDFLDQLLNPNKPLHDKKLQEYAVTATRYIAGLLDQSFLTGLMGAVEVFNASDTATGPSTFSNWLTNMATGLAPLGSLSRQYSRTVDPYYRRYEGPFEKMAHEVIYPAKLLDSFQPRLAEEAALYRLDLWGEPHRRVGGPPSVRKAISPTVGSAAISDPILDMLDEAGYYPGIPKGSSKYVERFRDLTPEEETWMGQVKGRLRRKALEVVYSKNWMKAIDEKIASKEEARIKKREVLEQAIRGLTSEVNDVGKALPLPPQVLSRQEQSDWFTAYKKENARLLAPWLTNPKNIKKLKEMFDANPAEGTRKSLQTMLTLLYMAQARANDKFGLYNDYTAGGNVEFILRHAMIEEDIKDAFRRELAGYAASDKHIDASAGYPSPEE